jgi:hypothetical protein
VLRAVAEKFPEVCVAEERFLAEFLGAVVERRQHIASGASCCEYCVTERGLGIGTRDSARLWTTRHRTSERRDIYEQLD